MSDEMKATAERLIELSEKATAGPWNEYCNTVPRGHRGGQDVRAEYQGWNRVCKDCTLEDMQFIAYARNSLPALAAEYLRLLAELDRTRTERDAAVAELDAPSSPARNAVRTTSEA